MMTVYLQRQNDCNQKKISGKVKYMPRQMRSTIAVENIARKSSSLQKTEKKAQISQMKCRHSDSIIKTTYNPIRGANQTIWMYTLMQVQTMLRRMMHKQTLSDRNRHPQVRVLVKMMILFTSKKSQRQPLTFLYKDIRTQIKYH